MHCDKRDAMRTCLSAGSFHVAVKFSIPTHPFLLGDQSLHLFLFSTKVIYKTLYIQMVLSYLYGEGVHANDTVW